MLALDALRDAASAAAEIILSDSAPDKPALPAAIIADDPESLSATKGSIVKLVHPTGGATSYNVVTMQAASGRNKICVSATGDSTVSVEKTALVCVHS